MQKIDWSPGQGRRGRPIRAVLGLTQRQGLILLCSLWGVAALSAGYAAIGGFDGPASSPAASSGSRPRGGSPVQGAATSTASPLPPDPAKASEVLLASTRHYADVFATAQKIVGHTRYADSKAWSEAAADKKSPAAQLIAFRSASNPEADLTYTIALGQATAAFGSGRDSPALGAWSTDMGDVHRDLTSWIGVAVHYQSSSASQADLDAVAAAVAADLAAAQTSATKVATS